MRLGCVVRVGEEKFNFFCCLGRIPGFVLQFRRNANKKRKKSNRADPLQEYQLKNSYHRQSPKIESIDEAVADRFREPPEPKSWDSLMDWEW